MIDTQALRSKILDLAMRGQLTEQLPEDGTAEELFRQIQAEKQALIKAGKIKKEKPLPEITGDDVPFEIPENWKWVRVNDIGSWSAGATPSRRNPDYYQNGTIPWIKTGELNDGYIIDSEEKITEKALQECSVRLNPVGSVLIAMYGATIGKLGILKVEATTNQACCACIPIIIYNRYLFYYLICNKSEFLHASHGGAQPNISKEIIIKNLIPLPPLAEQKRIVEKIERAFSILDTIDELQARYADNLAALRSKLIDLAIQGKLTDQRPEDGTAEELLSEMLDKKQELEASGVLKGRKKKNIKSLDEEEIPFQIPDTWRWIRLNSVAEIFGRIGFRGYTKNDIVEQGNGAISLSPSNITKDGKIVFDKCTYITWEKYEESPEIMVFDDDIILVKTGSSYGKCTVVKSLPEKATINPQLAILKNVFCNRYYLHVVLNSEMARKQYEEFVVGAATPTFSQEDLANFLLPLPPLAEQERIVKRLEELLPICEGIS